MDETCPVLEQRRTIWTISIYPIIRHQGNAVAPISVALFLRGKTVLPAGCSNNKPTTASVKERSSTNFIPRISLFFPLLSLLGATAAKWRQTGLAESGLSA